MSLQQGQRDHEQQDNLQMEFEHLARVWKQNGYHANFICDASAQLTQETANTRQRTGAVGEGGHTDDTLRGVLQLRWRTGSLWLLDHCDEEADLK